MKALVGIVIFAVVAVLGLVLTWGDLDLDGIKVVTGIMTTLVIVFCGIRVLFGNGGGGDEE